MRKLIFKRDLMQDMEKFGTRKLREEMDRYMDTNVLSSTSKKEAFLRAISFKNFYHLIKTLYPTEFENNEPVRLEEFIELEYSDFKNKWENLREGAYQKLNSVIAKKLGMSHFGAVKGLQKPLQEIKLINVVALYELGYINYQDIIEAENSFD